MSSNYIYAVQNFYVQKKKRKTGLFLQSSLLFTLLNDKLADKVFRNPDAGAGMHDTYSYLRVITTKYVGPVTGTIHKGRMGIGHTDIYRNIFPRRPIGDARIF